MDPLIQFEAHVREHDPDLLASFEEQYEDPVRHALVSVVGDDGTVTYPEGYIGTGTCERCGAFTTYVDAWPVHLTWHRALSLHTYAMGSMMRTMSDVVMPGG